MVFGTFLTNICKKCGIFSPINTDTPKKLLSASRSNSINVSWGSLVSVLMQLFCEGLRGLIENKQETALQIQGTKQTGQGEG